MVRIKLVKIGKNVLVDNAKTLQMRQKESQIKEDGFVYGSIVNDSKKSWYKKD